MNIEGWRRHEFCNVNRDVGQIDLSADDEPAVCWVWYCRDHSVYVRAPELEEIHDV